LPRTEPSKHLPKKGDVIFFFCLFERDFAPISTTSLIGKQYDDF